MQLEEGAVLNGNVHMGQDLTIDGPSKPKTGQKPTGKAESQPAGASTGD